MFPFCYLHPCVGFSSRNKGEFMSQKLRLARFSNIVEIWNMFQTKDKKIHCGCKAWNRYTMFLVGYTLQKLT